VTSLHAGRNKSNDTRFSNRCKNGAAPIVRQYQKPVANLKAIRPKWVENDGSARPPNLPSASCDLDMWPSDPKS